jgi:hypothetical protein
MTKTMYEESGIEELAIALYFQALYPDGATHIKPTTVWHNASNKPFWRARAVTHRQVLRAVENDIRMEETP